MNNSKNFNKRLNRYLKKRGAIIEKAKSWDNEKQRAHQHILSIMGRPTLIELTEELQKRPKGMAKDFRVLKKGNNFKYSTAPQKDKPRESTPEEREAFFRSAHKLTNNNS